MALFLSESVQTKLPRISLEEALSNLINIQIEGVSLTEAIYQADFILHEETKTLENDLGTNKAKVIGLKKDMNFLQKSWEAIKAFAKKVWMNVKQIYRTIKERIVTWFNQITGSKGEILVVSKSKLNRFKLMMNYAEEMNAVNQRKFEEASDRTEAVDAVVEKYKDRIDNIDNDDTGTIKIAKSQLIALGKEAQKLFESSEKNGEKKVELSEATSESMLKAAGDDKETKEKVKALIQQHKNIATTSTKIATLNSKIYSALVGMMTAGTSVMEKE